MLLTCHTCDYVKFRLQLSSTLGFTELICKIFFPPSLLLDLIDFIFTNLWYNFGKWWKDLYFSLLKLRMVYLAAASDLSNH